MHTVVSVPRQGDRQAVERGNPQQSSTAVCSQMQSTLWSKTAASRRYCHCGSSARRHAGMHASAVLHAWAKKGGCGSGRTDKQRAPAAAGSTGAFACAWLSCLVVCYGRTTDPGACIVATPGGEVYTCVRFANERLANQSRGLTKPLIRFSQTSVVMSTKATCGRLVAVVVRCWVTSQPVGQKMDPVNDHPVDQAHESKGQLSSWSDLVKCSRIHAKATHWVLANRRGRADRRSDIAVHGVDQSNNSTQGNLPSSCAASPARRPRRRITACVIAPWMALRDDATGMTGKGSRR